ncbi:PREDICTED: uncharacterized protein LOC105148723 [Acromyrmex echinatior]|uniref:uncharacterized protein LOC105148723 n=1 Tax=Acromyrmex echinatior TaxID=103372 RepID=UPI000581023F|nr:PREDICTED: uncharacterized protein LOC105148723 [Acromyrmex echinatior]
MRMLNNADIINYLMEQDDRDEQSTKKKKTIDESTDANPDKDNISNRHQIAHRPTVRILERRYPLTATGYKYLNIGINVTLPSYVTIILGDCHGKEIPLSPDIWRELLEQKHTSFCPFCSTTKIIKEYVRRLQCTLEI